MAANLAKWPSNRGLISKIRPSDGCKGNTVPSTVVQGYDLRKPGGHLGNVGLKGAYILSLTGRFAGYRSSRLSCNAVAEGWLFRSWAVVLRSCRLMRARNCRLSI